MQKYLVIPRRYRPQTFSEIYGQRACVVTLQNAIKSQRLAPAYLFYGTKGTGKTTIARVLSKAINCENLSASCEPCNQCQSCQEITAGNSLDVIEIDGASHRGIDDIRKIHETVTYTPSIGHYKVYIIDEVHMLTKEAFNALLKTLEEPPKNVIFLFATTESHKVPPTILSRCQRFSLKRISSKDMVEKLKAISKDLKIDTPEDIFHLICQVAEGSLRDAEALYDQILSFSDGKADISFVEEMLSMVPKDIFFDFSLACKNADLSAAFKITSYLFNHGYDSSHFLEKLMEYFRDLLVIQLRGAKSPSLVLSFEDMEKYKEHSRMHSPKQCTKIIEILSQAQNQMRQSLSKRITLEMILLQVIESYHTVSPEELILRLNSMQSRIQDFVQDPTEKQPSPIKKALPQKNIKREPSPTNQNADSDWDDLSFQEAPKISESKKTSQKQVSSSEKQKDLSFEEKKRMDALIQFVAVELEGKARKTS